MENVKHKILVMSGKGGVGKTTIAVNLAQSLSNAGLKVGVLDVDVHGPNVPKMLGLEGASPQIVKKKVMPVKTKTGLKVISLAFFLKTDDDAVIWRGPAKHGLIKQFLEDVEWGELDYLVVDFPPGTGDECISVAQLLKNITGSVIVSTPQEVSILDSKKCIGFSKTFNIPIIGLVENMSGDMFGSGTIEEIAKSKGVPFLGALKLDKAIVLSGDSGNPFVLEKDTNAGKEFEIIVDQVKEFCEMKKKK